MRGIGRGRFADGRPPVATEPAETDGSGQIPANLGASSLDHIPDMAFTPILDLVKNFVRQNCSTSTENTLEIILSASHFRKHLIGRPAGHVHGRSDRRIIGAQKRVCLLLQIQPGRHSRFSLSAKCFNFLKPF